MIKRLLTTAAVTIVLASLSATTAQAAATPRVTGSYTVTTTITAHKANSSDVGSSSTTTWKFTPSCTGTGGCNTTLVRPRTSGHPTSVTTVLSPVQVNGAWHYKGSKTYLSACFLDDGSIVEKAYSTKETTDLTVTKINTSNKVTAFKGTLVLVFTPTASAPAGCASDRIAARFQTTN
jgi:hypothetical protein